MHRPIMRITFGVLLVFLACAGVAQAHDVTNAQLSCKGLTFDYSGFPSTPASETETWSTGQTVIAPTTGSSGTITTPLPIMKRLPNGLVMTVSGHRTGATDGTFTVTASLFCQSPPPPPPPLTCTPPATPQNGMCVTPPPPPPPPVPPTTPPTATPPPVAPPPPPPVVPPTRHRRHHHPAPCVKIPGGKFHASIGPQGLLRGNATLTASCPKKVTRITVTVYGAGGHVWSKTYRGHHLRLRLDVTSKKIWGVDSRCGCTYGPKDRVVVTFHYRCGTDVVRLRFNNRDPLGRFGARLI